MKTNLNGIGCTIHTDAGEFPIVSSNPAIQAEYISMRRAGESHSISDMLAHRSAPDLRTDATYLCNMPVDEDPIVRRYRKDAEAEGVNTSGAVYLSKLAEYPGDPKAFIRGRGDIVKLCEERNYALEMDGRQIVKQEAIPPKQETEFSPDIIEDRMIERFDAAPGLEEECARKPAKLREVYEESRESLKPDWAKAA